MTVLEVRNIKKIYTTRFGGSQCTALSNVSFDVEEGEFIAIMGPSGSGKTTLLNILASLDNPSGGKVFLDGKDMSTIKDSSIPTFRKGFLSSSLKLSKNVIRSALLLKSQAMITSLFICGHLR